MKGSYSVYVIFPKTIKQPEHLETNLPPDPPPLYTPLYIVHKI